MDLDQGLNGVDAIVEKLKTSKKGSASWNKFDPLSLKEEWKDPRLHYRWVLRHGDDMQIYKRIQQGYVFANPVTGSAVAGKATDIPGDTPVARELVLMATLKEWEDEYQAEIARRTEHTERGMKEKYQEELDKIQRAEGIRGQQVRQRLVIE